MPDRPRWIETLTAEEKAEIRRKLGPPEPWEDVDGAVPSTTPDPEAEKHAARYRRRRLKRKETP